MAEAVTERTAATLRLIAGAMGAGVVLLAGVAFYFFVAGEKTPQPGEVRVINILTGIVMLQALAAIAAAEFVWRKLLSRVEEPGAADGAVLSASIVRLALREGAAMLGLVVCLLAALNGTLRVYPAYWVNLAPSAFFLFFLAARWPSLDGLREQVREL